MSRKAGYWSVEEKIRMMEETRAPSATVAEVLRRHGIDATTYYRWEKQAKEGIRQALAGKPGDRGAKDREIERLKSEVARKSRIIAEVVEENLGLKKGI
jgi:transposase-like protein